MALEPFRASGEASEFPEAAGRAISGGAEVRSCVKSLTSAPAWGLSPDVEFPVRIFPGGGVFPGGRGGWRVWVRGGGEEEEGRPGCGFRVECLGFRV